MKGLVLNNTQGRREPSGNRVGAVIVGGDFHGLGIIRSLGRRGVPLCVVDDEYSIGRFSKYTTFTVPAPNLRKEQEAVDFLLEMGHRMKLEGWVLFPTRDEHVAAFFLGTKQHNAVTNLPEFLRLTGKLRSGHGTKWNTYSLAQQARHSHSPHFGARTRLRRSIRSTRNFPWRSNRP